MPSILDSRVDFNVGYMGFMDFSIRDLEIRVVIFYLWHYFDINVFFQSNKNGAHIYILYSVSITIQGPSLGLVMSNTNGKPEWLFLVCYKFRV